MIITVIAGFIVDAVVFFPHFVKEDNLGYDSIRKFLKEKKCVYH